jgi:hypothetical protein
MLQRCQNRFRHGEEFLWLAPVTAAILLLVVVAEGVGAAHGYSITAGLGHYSSVALRFLPPLLSIAGLALLIPAALSRSASPLEVALRPVRRRLGSPALALAAVGPLLLMPILFSGYSLLKVLLPFYAPFAWDDGFAALDRILFFGNQPWTLTHALFGSVPATVFIDRMYTLWILFISISIVSFALFAPRYDRARFFLCFTASWLLLGTLGAYLGSSAGPCYTALIGAASAPEYAGLMQALRAVAAPDGVHLDALRWQGVLWNVHSSGDFAFGMGISAMPSLHNAVAVLYALSLSRVGRHIGALAWVYAAIIFIGSIHLGWHYAVDGIVSTVAMIGLWKLAGWYLKRSGYEAAVIRPEAPAEADAAVPALA